jgi:hypothetical protein
MGLSFTAISTTRIFTKLAGFSCPLLRQTGLTRSVLDVPLPSLGNNWVNPMQVTRKCLGVQLFKQRQYRVDMSVKTKKPHCHVDSAVF